MSILDPSIIMASGDISNPNKLLDLKLGMQKLQANDQSAKRQNALAMLLANPQSYTNGQLTPQAKQATFAADPQLGLEIQKQDMNVQVAKAKQAASATAAGAKKFDLYSKLAGVGVNAYEEAKKSGKSEEDARGAAVLARNTAAQEAYESGNGLLSDQDYTGLTSHKFDPLGATALASLDKYWSTGREKVKSDDRADRRETRMENMEGARLGMEDKRLSIEERRIADAEGKAGDQSAKWEVLTDTKKDDAGNPVQYRYNPATAKATTLTGDPYTPAGASKIGSSGAQDVSMTPDAIETEAKRYNLTGKLPALGMGKSGDRQAILNKASDLLKSSGASTGENVAAQAAVKADTSSLSNITKIADSAAAYENTALENMGIVKEKMPKGAGPTAIPLLDRWVQDGRTAFGNEDVPPYATALVTVANEYAKVMSGSTGAQGSTVDSRREAAELLNAGLNKGQIDNVLDVMRADMENKKKSYRQQVDEVKGRISGGGTTSAKPTASLPKVSDKASYQALKSGDRFLDPDGHERVKP